MSRLDMPLYHQPVPKGRLVKLRPLHPGDRDALYAVAADPRIWEQHPLKDRHGEVVFDATGDSHAERPSEAPSSDRC